MTAHVEDKRCTLKEYCAAIFVVALDKPDSRRRHSDSVDKAIKKLDASHTLLNISIAHAKKIGLIDTPEEQK